jgi:hypothetical protein
MMFLIEQQGKRLVARAKEELDHLSGDEVDGGWEAPRAGKEELEAMIKRVRVEARKGEEYEVKKGDYDQKAGEQNGDVAMGGMDDIPKRRSAAQIRYKLTKDLNELVRRGVREMDAYDAHAKETTKVYWEALERGKRNGKFTFGQVPRGGILKTRNEEIMVDDQVRKLSTGMPVVGLPPQDQPVRTFENLGELARRGSK